MKRGQVVLVNFPFTDLTASKQRPAIVISNEQSPEGDLIFAFITSNLNRPAGSTDLILKEGEDGFSETGLKKTSVIRLGKLVTLNQKLVLGEIGYLGDKEMKFLDEKLSVAVGLSGVSEKN